MEGLWSRIDRLALEHKFTFRYMADQIDVPESTVSMWRKNQTIPKADETVRIARLFGTTVEYLITGEYEGGLTHEQREMITKYYALDEWGKQTVQDLIDSMYERQQERWRRENLDNLAKDTPIEDIPNAYRDEEGSIHPLEVKESVPVYGQFYLHEFEEEDMLVLPILGKTAAGTPIDAQETLQFPRRLLKGNETDYFCLEVEGYSMTEAGIDDGDHVILRRTDIPENERIMLIQHEGQTTLKKLKIKNGITYLCWENGTNHEPIVVNSDGFIVQGALVHIIKTP